MLKNRGTTRSVARNRSLQRTRHFSLSPETKRGIAVVVLFTLAAVTLLSFFQATGDIGAVITRVLGAIFGWGDWLFPIILFILSYQLLRPGRYDIRIINYIGLALTIAGYSGLLHLAVRDMPIADIASQRIGGGYVGYAVGQSLFQVAEFWGALLILIAVSLIGLFVFLNTSFATLVNFWQHSLYLLGSAWRNLWPARAKQEPDYGSRFTTAELSEPEDTAEEAAQEEEQEPETAPTSLLRTTRAMGTQHHEERAPVHRAPQPKIDIPFDLLLSQTDQPASGDIRANMKKIEETLKSFGITVTMGEVSVGPTVTQYTLKPTEGVKLNQITALHNDLALALAAHPIRMEAPIPGKSLVGIEVPNQSVSIVRLREILQSSVYENRKSSLMVTLGKDVSGRVMMADLGKMPHLLIAGATGSGKSVCINSMLVTLLYGNSPDLMKLILVDPKRVELSSYDGIPHLLTPVIIDIEKTINALRWAVAEMDRRYHLLSAAGRKNIEAYNEARLLDKLPYIVIVVDELADLMMVAAKEVESAIIRLAQMARAVGIHLILATQRPSVNVITGLIKANITSRIAFAVASATDSRTIIDSSGAEKLLGNGDMLYISAELSKPKRIQGAFVTDKEITAVTDYLKAHGEPQYESGVTERRASQHGLPGSFETDADEGLLRDAAAVVIRAKRASATLLQSRMRVGFAKASRIMDLLEERGIIGPQNSSKPREVLIGADELDEYFGTGADSEEISGEEFASADETDNEEEFTDMPAEEENQNDEDRADTSRS